MLQYAVLFNSVEVAAILLDDGAGVDEAVDSDRSSPLHVAATYKHIDVLRMLLRRGASPDHLDATGNDVFISCVKGDPAQRHLAIVDLLKVLNDHVLLDPNTSESLSGYTPLHLTAQTWGGPEIVFLINFGCDIELLDEEGLIALAWAAASANSTAYFSLLAHGATIECAEDFLLGVIADRATEVECRPSRRHDFDVLTSYDVIVKDLLHRRADLTTSFHVVNDRPADVEGPAIPMRTFGMLRRTFEELRRFL